MGRVTMTDRVLDLMRTEPEALWRSAKMAALLDVPPDRVNTALYRLRQLGLVTRVREGVHVLGGEVEELEALPPAPPPPAPSPARDMPFQPIERRPVDERQAYEALRTRGPLSARRAACHLNTSYSRAERLLDALVREGYASCRDGVYVRREHA